MLKVLHDPDTSNETAGGSMLDEIVRDGARQMLAAALQAEVAAYIEAFADQLDENGHRLVVRNGFHEPREVTTAAGAVPVRQPRVNDKRSDEVTGKRKRFASAIRPAWARRSPSIGAWRRQASICWSWIGAVTRRRSPRRRKSACRTRWRCRRGLSTPAIG